MLLGIDFGTTRTVVAAVDRGNYPVVSFQTPGGDTHEWYPSLVAAREGARVFGFEAVAADGATGYQLRERFTRHFGVWRETEDGRSVALDVLFEKETLLPEKNQRLTRARRYQPTHNIGHFRFLECSRIDAEGHPTGDLTPWDELYFPFDPALRGEARLESVPVKRTAPAEQLIEELYTYDENGIIEVSIIDHTNHYQRAYRIHGSHAVARAVQ
jgi:hypothetical protein